jgi:hypothetical protein
LAIFCRKGGASSNNPQREERRLTTLINVESLIRCLVGIREERKKEKKNDKKDHMVIVKSDEASSNKTANVACCGYSLIVNDSEPIQIDK